MKQKIISQSIAGSLALFALFGCSGGSTASGASSLPVETAVVSVPTFCADSAFANVKAQTDLGPRVPGSQAHRQCVDWLQSELSRFGADSVVELRGTVEEVGAISNIWTRFGKEKTQRILLLAHFDTRPVADEDPNPEHRQTPIDGANDGASGVGVILEIARLVGQNKNCPVGVDVLFVDAEDSGNEGDEDSWARGAQHFVANMNYGKTEPLPSGAILLDMVGGKDAMFHKELFSFYNATDLQESIRAAAQRAGFGDRFPNDLGGAINDDHVHLLKAGIPCIDIIECKNPTTGGFNPTWHTLSDNIDNIDPQTLNAVGQTITEFIFNRK